MVVSSRFWGNGFLSSIYDDAKAKAASKRSHAEAMQQTHDAGIKKLLNGVNEIIGDSFEVLHSLPGTLSFLPFTAQSQFENNCENSIVMMMQENSLATMRRTLERFEDFLESNHDAGDDVLAKEPFNSTLKHSWRAVQGMEIFLNDRKLLKNAVAKLAEHGATLHETKAIKEDGANRLQNNHSWLRRICVSHKDCAEWLDLMDLDCLSQGDVVLHFGSQTKMLAVAGDDDLVIASDESLYIMFFDIGSAFDRTYTRRMHLRLTHPGRKIQPENATALHGALRDVLVRCMVHDAILDTNKKNIDSPNAGSLSEAYNVSLWVGTLSARQKFLFGKPKKTTKK